MSLLYESSVPADELLALARFPTLVLGVILTGLIGWWAYRLWGRAAALLAVGLAAFEPNLLAHSCLVNTDSGVALFIFLTLYLWWEYNRSPSMPLLIGIGASTGLALASKFSGVFLIGMVGLLSLVSAVGPKLLPIPGGRETGEKPRLRGLCDALMGFLLVSAVALIVVACCYFVHDFSRWWEGLQIVLAHNKHGHPAFFMGDYSEKGWRSFFPVAFLIKTPLPILFATAASICCGGFGKPFAKKDVWLLLVPVALYFAIAIYAHINIGLRHLLPVYPLVLVIAGRTATINLRPGWLSPVLSTVLIAWSALSVLRVAPHQLAYFNELIGGPRYGHLYLGDSNLDWGQDLKGIKQYMDQEGLNAIYLSYFGKAPPAYYGIRYQPLPAPVFVDWALGTPGSKPHFGKREILAISVSNLQGILLADRDLYSWLRTRTPVATIGYSVHMYDISRDADAHLRLARIFVGNNDRAAAEVEYRKVLSLDSHNAEATCFLTRPSQP